jgi:predicted AlkP superfamily phosphohydrolase/phosphomutase
VHVVDWGTHDPGVEGFQVTPRDLAGEILARHGRDPVGICDHYGADLESVRTLRHRLLARIESKTAIVVDLLARAPSDLFFGVFAESHCAGHQFWRLHDPSHPRHDAGIRSTLGDPLETIYRALDAALACVLAELPPTTTVMVLASHGMGAHYDAALLLADMLSSIHAGSARLAAVGLLQRTWQALPAGWRAAIAPPLVRAGVRLSARRAGAPPGLASALRAPDPSRLPYFAVPNNDSHGGIRINLAGREPAGCVRPEDLDRTIDELRARLATFVNEETGRPVVAAIHRIQDLYPGEDVAAFPDLIVDWDRSFPIRRIRSAAYGRLARESISPRTGDHRPEGLLIARGPGIAAGGTLPPVPSAALAATVSHLLGVNRTDLDAHPIPALSTPPV